MAMKCSSFTFSILVFSFSLFFQFILHNALLANCNPSAVVAIVIILNRVGRGSVYIFCLLEIEGFYYNVLYFFHRPHDSKLGFELVLFLLIIY